MEKQENLNPDQDMMNENNRAEDTRGETEAAVNEAEAPVAAAVNETEAPIAVVANEAEAPATEAADEAEEPVAEAADEAEAPATAAANAAEAPDTAVSGAAEIPDSVENNNDNLPETAQNAQNEGSPATSVEEQDNNPDNAETASEVSEKPQSDDTEALPSRKASIRRQVDKLKQVNYKEKLDSLVETGIATKDTLVKTTKEMSNSETGKLVVLQTRKAEHFFKSRKGKRVIAIAVVLILALIGFGRWHAGADLRKGLKLCESGNYVDAQTPLTNAVARDNMNPKAYVALGMAYLGSDEYDEAAKQFQLALNLDEENQDAYRGLGITYYKTGDYEEAVTAFDKALDLCDLNVNNTEYDIMWYRGACECAMEDYDAAVYTYSALLELEGDTALTRYYRGSVYCLMNDKENAMADFDAAIAMKGNGYDLFFDIYNSMNDAGWTEEARAYLDKTMDSGYVDASTVPDAVQKTKYEGMVYYLEGSYEQALELFSDAGLSDDFEAQSYAGLCYEALGKNKKAQNIYKALIEANPNKAEAYNVMALYLIRVGKYKKAVSYLNQGINNCPAADQQVLYYNIVTAYECKGDMEAAQEALRQYGVIYGQSSITHENAFAKERDRS